MTYNYETRQYCLRLISFNPGKKTITIGKTEGSFSSKFTAFRLVLHDFGDIMGLKVNGQEQPLKLKSSTQRFFETELTQDNIEIKY